MKKAPSIRTIKAKQAAKPPKTAGVKRSARDKLWDAAGQVVGQKDYAATSVDDLCQAAGVTKGAFFHHFASKEDLAVAAANYWSDFTTEFFNSAPYQAKRDPLERLLGYIDFRREILRGKIEDF